MSNENTAKYAIINKDVNNLQITGFTIENEEKKHKLVNKSDVIRLIRSGKIKNARAVLNTYNAEYEIVIEDGLKSLPDNTKNISNMTLLGRLIDTNNKCVGYKAQDSNGKIYKLSIQKVWELSTAGLVDGCTGKIIKDTKIIESDAEHRLEELPKLYV